ncbi:unnamed protein product [Adineta ricciae]|nr:unnamed protein product [Adineta ricciae]
MPVNWGIQKDVYCAGNDKTFTFLEDVLTEVAALFPGEIIHIGGDECPKDRWKACPKCQQRIKANNLKDEHELQSYFITRIEKFLQTKGKRIIGWDEILEGGLAPNAAVMSWRGTEGGIQAARLLHPVVMTPNQFMYFDYYQGETYLEPYCIGGFLPLRKVYEYEPVPAELTAAEAKYIVGVQGNVWGEYIHSPEKSDYMTFPRAAAMAETGWSSAGNKNWDDFARRMESQYRRYEKAGIGYAASAYNVMFKVQADSARNKAVVTLTTDSYRPVIRYTTNSSEPTAASPRYQQPIEVTMPVNIKAAVFEGNRVRGKTVSAAAPFQIRCAHRIATIGHARAARGLRIGRSAQNLSPLSGRGSPRSPAPATAACAARGLAITAGLRTRRAAAPAPAIKRCRGASGPHLPPVRRDDGALPAAAPPASSAPVFPASAAECHRVPGRLPGRSGSGCCPRWGRIPPHAALPRTIVPALNASVAFGAHDEIMGVELKTVLHRGIVYFGAQLAAAHEVIAVEPGGVRNPDQLRRGFL